MDEAEEIPADGRTTEAEPVAVNNSPPGRPKRKRAAAKPVSSVGSDDDGGGDSESDRDDDDDDDDDDFGAKQSARNGAGRARKSSKSTKRTTSASAKSTKRKPAAPAVRVPQRPRRRAADKGAAATAAMAASDAQDTRPKGHGSNDDDDIYRKLFAPMTEQEIQEWQGWCDIESEPDFFNFILHELGVRNATVQEVYGIDKDTLRGIENPLGLIFLYKYVEEDVHDPRDGLPDALWFANQTTDNACGTLAMLNIAMNQESDDKKGGLHLGPHLARFKTATRHLHPALRGRMLSADAYIRAKHNAFARRLDMLAADAKLQASWEASGEQQMVKKKSRRKTTTGKSTADDAAFHFIAYVPVGDDVWELNGMQPWPRRLDRKLDQTTKTTTTDTPHWTEAASERIAARMQGYDGEAGFSLLALCGTGGGNHDSDNADSQHRLATAATRRGDYTPAIYCWLKKLADKGVLRRLATGDEAF